MVYNGYLIMGEEFKGGVHLLRTSLISDFFFKIRKSFLLVFLVVQSQENLENMEKSWNKILVRENLENLKKSGNCIERAKNAIGNNAFFVLKRGPVLILETSVGKMMKLP